MPSASSKPSIIQFLNKHDILWMPIADIKLNAKGKKVFSPKDNKDLLGYEPKTSDFKTCELEEIKARQKKYTKTNTIAIDTSYYAIIDCDTPDIPPEVQEIMKRAPYYKSYSKELPKIFVKLQNEVTKENTKTKFGSAVEIQTGIWSFARLDAVVENVKEAMPYIDISSWIEKKDTKATTLLKLLAKLDEARCRFIHD